MNLKFHSGQANLAYDDYLEKLGSHVCVDLPAIHVHDPKVVGERLIQRLADIIYWPFVAAYAKDWIRGADDERNRLVDCDGIWIDPKSGLCRISFFRWIRAVGEFFVYWAHLISAIVFGWPAKGSSSRNPATLVFGVGQESLFNHQSDERFIEFCKSGPIPGLSGANWLIVQSVVNGSRSVAPEWVTYHRFPLNRLIADGGLGLSGRLTLLMAQLRALFTFLTLSVRHPLIALLARDIATCYVVKVLDQRGLIDTVIVSNVQCANQFLWMRSPAARTFKVQMVWYSQNIQPMVYRFDRLVSHLPYYRHMRVDMHWVWTPGLKSYLEMLGIACPIHVIGPMLWYLPKHSLQQKDDSIRIVLFDVTPVTDARAEQIGLIGNYYCVKNMIRFIEESIAVCDEVRQKTGRPLQVFLKHKRGHNRTHDLRYLDLISQLTGPGGKLTLLPFDTNMYDLLRDSTVAVVAPYSSPAYVADAVGTRAVFFDPTGDLLPTYEETRFVSFASRRDELRELLLSAVGSRATLPNDG